MLLDAMRVLQMPHRLKAASFTDEQANALTEEMVGFLTEELATKADLRELRTEIMGKFAEQDGKFAEIEGKIAEVRNEVANLKVSIADFKTSIAKWAVGIIVAILLSFTSMAVAVLVAAFRLAG